MEITLRMLPLLILLGTEISLVAEIIKLNR